jgi:trigger factor
MKTTLEETEKHKVKLTVEVAPDDMGKDLDRTYRKIAQQVRIPGFRKGKVPRKVIDAQIGKDAVMQEFVEDKLYDYYMDAVREHDLAPISDPELDIDELEEGKPLVFTAEVEVRPRLTIDNYDGVEVEAPSVVVGENEIDEYVDRLRERFAELEPVGRPARDGDFVFLDIRTTIHEEEIGEATRTDYLCEVGSGAVVPKLDEELLGKKGGDILKFNADLPEGAGDHGGEEASFQVLVKEVKARKLPESNDEFAKTASEFDTMAELREDLRTKLEEMKGRDREAAIRDLVLQKMVDSVDVDLPESLVDTETESRVESARERAERAGLTLEQLLESQGWDELRFRADARDHAVRAIKADLVLESVARQEEIEVTPEELGAEIAALAQLTGREPKELAKALDRSGQIVSVAGDILRSKALDHMVEHANVETSEIVETDEVKTDETDAEPPRDDPDEDSAEASAEEGVTEDE